MSYFPCFDIDLCSAECCSWTCSLEFELAKTKETFAHTFLVLGIRAKDFPEIGKIFWKKTFHSHLVIYLMFTHQLFPSTPHNLIAYFEVGRLTKTQTSVAGESYTESTSHLTSNRKNEIMRKIQSLPCCPIKMYLMWSTTGMFSEINSFEFLPNYNFHPNQTYLQNRISYCVQRVLGNVMITPTEWKLRKLLCNTEFTSLHGDWSTVRTITTALAT